METVQILNFQDTVLFKIEQVADLFSTLGKQFFKNHNLDIDHEEFRTLDVITCNPSCCQRDLAKLILRNRVQTGRILTALEEKGLIERFNDTKGKYLVKRMRITEAGKKCYEKALEVLAPAMQEFSKNFSEEHVTLLKDMLNKLFNAALSSVKTGI